MRGGWRWAPASLLAAGALVTLGLDTQKAMPLMQPLGEAVPSEIGGYVSRDLALPEDQVSATGLSDYLMRVYEPIEREDLTASVSLFIAYYDEQRQGKTIHSPKNCLPGTGWEPLASQTIPIQLAGKEVMVNHYTLQRGDERALVLYWYQGRGRIEANEYRVKWDLLKDSALRGRSEEALVRVVVPIASDGRAELELVKGVARAVAPALSTALPGRV